MKIIRYTLESDGTIPTSVIEGGYFGKKNNNSNPQDYDLIGFSDTWTGLEEYQTKADLETYVYSFLSDYIDEATNTTRIIQDLIDNFWSRKND